jgi:hypothetical protein
MNNTKTAQAISTVARLACEGSRVETVAKLRGAMRVAYDAGQTALATSIFQAIVELNCRHFDAIARASELPSTIADDEVGRIVRARAANH